MTQQLYVLLQHAAPISGSVAVLLALVSLFAQISRLIYKYRLTALKKASPEQLVRLVGDESIRLGISAKDTTPKEQARFINTILQQREKNSQRFFVFSLVAFILFTISTVIIVYVYHQVPFNDKVITDVKLDKKTLEGKIIWFQSLSLGLNKNIRIIYLIKDGKRHRIVSPTIVRYFYEHIPPKAVTEEVADLFPEGDKITYRNGMYVKHYAPSMCAGGCPRYMIIENQLRPINNVAAATYGCISGKAVEMVQEDIDGSADSLGNPAPELKERESESGVAKTIKCLLPQSEG